MQQSPRTWVSEQEFCSRSWKETRQGRERVINLSIILSTVTLPLSPHSKSIKKDPANLHWYRGQSGDILVSCFLSFENVTRKSIMSLARMTCTSGQGYSLPPRKADRRLFHSIDWRIDRCFSPLATDLGPSPRGEYLQSQFHSTVN